MLTQDWSERRGTVTNKSATFPTNLGLSLPQVQHQTYLIVCLRAAGAAEYK